MKLRHVIFMFIALAALLPATVQAEKYAFVNISTAYVRSRPSHAAELVTQQLMGFPVKILSSEGEWSHIETIDGYKGYIIDNTIVPVSQPEYDEWKHADRVVVKSHKELPVTDLYGTPLSDIVPGAVLRYAGSNAGDPLMAHVILPDGREGLLPGAVLVDIKEWSEQPLAVEEAIAYGMDNLGSPYLWGGMSPKGMDCSGLTWTAYWLNGRLLSRDASKQALMGNKIKDWRLLRAGDLAFFGNPATQRITHVALLRDDKGNIVHSSQGMVRLNSLDPDAPDHIGARFLWGISSDSFVPVMDDSKASWLFDK